jgi:hypothetical protein
LRIALKLSKRWAAMCGADVALYAGDVDRRTKEAVVGNFKPASDIAYFHAA